MSDLYHPNHDNCVSCSGKAMPVRSTANWQGKVKQWSEAQVVAFWPEFREQTNLFQARVPRYTKVSYVHLPGSYSQAPLRKSWFGDWHFFAILWDFAGLAGSARVDEKLWTVSGMRGIPHGNSCSSSESPGSRAQGLGSLAVSEPVISSLALWISRAGWCFPFEFVPGLLSEAGVMILWYIKYKNSQAWAYFL